MGRIVVWSAGFVELSGANWVGPTGNDLGCTSASGIGFTVELSTGLFCVWICGTVVAPAGGTLNVVGGGELVEGSALGVNGAAGLTTDRLPQQLDPPTADVPNEIGAP